MITTLAWVVLLTALTRPLRQVLRPSSPARMPRKPDAVFEDKAEFADFAGPAGAQPSFWEFRDFGELCKRRGSGSRGKPVSGHLNAGITSRANKSTECRASSTVMSPKASQGTK